jgi:hypothetical protein
MGLALVKRRFFVGWPQPETGRNVLKDMAMEQPIARL